MPTDDRAKKVPRVDLGWYADRILASQDVRFGPLRRRTNDLAGVKPVDPLDVAAVLHGMADHTMIGRLLDEVVDREGLCPLGDPHHDYEPRATSLGRWFHQVADAIEWNNYNEGLDQ